MRSKIFTLPGREWFVFVSWSIIVAAVFLGFETIIASPEDDHFVKTILWIAVLLLLARLGGSVKKLGQPRLLGEVLIGILLGNLVLLGIPWFEEVGHNEIIGF